MNKKVKIPRIIPKLDIKGPNLVKGVNLEGLRVLGDPRSFIKSYYELGADELVYHDTVASLYLRNNLDKLLKATSKNIFMPIIVGVAECLSLGEVLVVNSQCHDTSFATKHDHISRLCR